jgi:outer membrane lipoprotein SlyB
LIMNRKQHNVVLAGLLALALAGCSSTRGGSSADEMGGAGSTGTAGAEGGSMASPTTQSQGAAGTATMPGMMPNAVVTSIEAMPRQSAGAAVGGSGTTGTTGSSMGEDKMYRITLRMDDGTTRVVMQDKAPTFRMGDRVNMTDGAISH